MKSKWTRSSMPSFFNCRTTALRLDRRISGYVLSCISCLYAFSVYSRKHLPGRVRPARPALCCALALLIAVTSSDSTRIRGLYTCVHDINIHTFGMTKYNVTSEVQAFPANQLTCVYCSKHSTTLQIPIKIQI